MITALLQESASQVEASAATQFLTGYLGRLTQDDLHDYIRLCFKEDDDLSETMDKAMAF